MKKIVTRAAKTALAAGVAGGLVLAGTPAALAQEAPTTASGDGVGAGNAIGLAIDLPVTVCGLGVVGAGVATGICGAAPAPGGATPGAATPGAGDTPGGAPVAQASGNGVLTGNALGIDIDAPITVCGVGGALLGVATGTCAMPPPGLREDAPVARAQGDGLLSGNAVGLNVDVPINLCGIGIAVGGIATGDCVPAPAAAPGQGAGAAADSTRGAATTRAAPAGGGLRTAADDRDAGAGASDRTLAAGDPDPDSGASASGDGLLTGNASGADVDAPISACGVGVVGLGVATGTCRMDAPPAKAVSPPLSSPTSPTHPGSPSTRDCAGDCSTTRSSPRPAAARTSLDDDPPPAEHWSEAGVGWLPRTGGATEVAVPLGAGLLGAGLAVRSAARRMGRAARVRVR
jgi:hypothetical protein